MAVFGHNPEPAVKISYAGQETVASRRAERKSMAKAMSDADDRALLDEAIASLWAARPRHDTAWMARQLRVKESLVANRLAALRDAEHGPSFTDRPFGCPLDGAS